MTLPVAAPAPDRSHELANCLPRALFAIYLLPCSNKPIKLAPKFNIGFATLPNPGTLPAIFAILRVLSA